MDKYELFFVTLFLLMTLNPSDSESSSGLLFQFLDRPTLASELDKNRSNLFLPSNYFSELNQQYYLRFRRQAKMKKSHLLRPYPFELARYD
ncbi:uncharacterized protein Dwil_GK19063 [Drosophila willistoni]|uniref:Uncharacterized protein n=1 Tax=Drosophila willistoni TaxID=7260 RepID=B4MV04_DROWI|nr:uncharacterized protein Dwil_GK19063 [Drosophila willistoni]